MATVTAFDKINRIERRRKYHEWFDAMRIPEEDKRKRERLAEDIDDEWAIYLSLFLFALENDRRIDMGRAAYEHEERMRGILRNHDIPDNVIEDYLRDVADGEEEVTEERYAEGDYWTSPDRALDIALNDTNIVFHHTENQQAIADGMTMKQWQTMKDERVRPTHDAVDDTILPINEPFVVGGSLMMYPLDFSLGADASETCGCRCSCRYF